MIIFTWKMCIIIIIIIVVVIIIFLLENWFCAQNSKFLCTWYLIISCSLVQVFHEAKIWSPVLQFYLKVCNFSDANSVHKRFLQVSLGETALKFCILEQLFLSFSLWLVSGGETGILPSHLRYRAFLVPTPFDLQNISLLQKFPPISPTSCPFLFHLLYPSCPP